MSDHAISLTPELRVTLISYFLQKFEGKEESWAFTHIDDVKFNEMASYARDIFDGTNFISVSKKIAEYLYECSVRPNIKSGELFVVRLEDVNFDGKNVGAIGLFKSETKDTFLRFVSKNNRLEVENELGANINRLDKGCLILDSEDDKGYYVYTLDSSNRTDAKYWTDDFLSISPRQNEYSFTKDVLSLTRDFVSKVLPLEMPITKAEQVELLNKSVKYFKEKDIFSLENYKEEVLCEDTLIERFDKHKSSYEQARDIEVHDVFSISNSAVKKQERRMKSVIKLDNNFHIYVHGGEQLIQRGYDPQSGLQYYQIFFEEES